MCLSNKKRYDACALDQDEDDFEINMQSGRSRQLRRRRQEQVSDL